MTWNKAKIGGNGDSVCEKIEFEISNPSICEFN